MTSENENNTFREEPGSRYEVVYLAEVEMKPPEWVWRGRLMAGALTTVHAAPGVFESELLIEIIRRLSLRITMPDGSTPGGRCEPANALVVCADEHAANLTNSRLVAAGADCSRVFFLSGEAGDVAARIPRDIPTVEDLITANDVRLLVVDPAAVWIGRAKTAKHYSAVRGLITSLIQLGWRTRCAILWHQRFQVRSGRWSIDCRAAVEAVDHASRATFVIAPHPDQPGKQVFACSKISIAAMPSSISYEAGEIQNENNSPRIRWCGVAGVNAGEVEAAFTGKRRMKFENRPG